MPNFGPTRRIGRWALPLHGHQGLSYTANALPLELGIGPPPAPPAPGPPSRLGDHVSHSQVVDTCRDARQDSRTDVDIIASGISRGFFGRPQRPASGPAPGPGVQRMNAYFEYAKLAAYRDPREKF
jgi:hypothetical protein